MLTMKTDDPGILVIKASGRLSKADYDRFVPEFERIAGVRRPVRILIELDDFHGWDLPGLWQELADRILTAFKRFPSGDLLNLQPL